MRVEDVVHCIPAKIILKEVLGKALERVGGKREEFLETEKELHKSQNP